MRSIYIYIYIYFFFFLPNGLVSTNETIIFKNTTKLLRILFPIHLNHVLFICLDVRAVEFVILMKPIGISAHVLMRLVKPIGISTHVLMRLVKPIGISTHVLMRSVKPIGISTHVL